MLTWPTNHRPMPRGSLIRFCLVFLILLGLPASGPAATSQPPVYIGFDGEIGHATSTSDEAIIMGARIAIAEINQAGGVLGGRPLELVIKDNRSVPARGVANIRAFAEIPDLVAVLGGKFSPVVLEELPILHEKKMIMLAPWSAADQIIDHDYQPNFCFRLSLKDSWAAQAMLEYGRKRGFKKFAILLPLTAWGRSNEQALNNYAAKHQEIVFSTVQWFHWGDKTLLAQYKKILQSRAEAVIFVTNEDEGAVLVKEVAALPAAERLPLISHWGVTGGDFVKLSGDALLQLDFATVQTYSFFDRRRPEKLARFYQTAEKLFQVRRPEDILSPVGVAHTYDLIHILALAIDKAASVDREKVRDALEKVADYDGLIKFYPRPFTAQRHEALTPEDLFMGRFRADGAILRITE